MPAPDPPQVLSALAERVLRQAQRWRPDETAAIITIRAASGDLLERRVPAIEDRAEAGTARIVWDDALRHSPDECWPASERRLVRIAAALPVGHRVALAEQLSGHSSADAAVLVDAFTRFFLAIDNDRHRPSTGAGSGTPAPQAGNHRAGVPQEPSGQ